MSLTPVSSSPRVPPYVGVTHDQTREVEGVGRVRVIIYAAYDAFGLIGSEKNGIAVFHEDDKEVITDELAIADTGYFGPSAKQLELFNFLMRCDPAMFIDIVNNSPRSRYPLSDALPH